MPSLRSHEAPLHLTSPWESLGGRRRVELLSQKNAAGCPRTTNAGASLTTGSGAEFCPPPRCGVATPAGD